MVNKDLLPESSLREHIFSLLHLHPKPSQANSDPCLLCLGHVSIEMGVATGLSKSETIYLFLLKGSVVFACHEFNISIAVQVFC